MSAQVEDLPLAERGLRAAARIGAALRHPVMLVALVAIPFAIVRVPQLAQIAVNPDTGSYLRLAEDVLEGRLPRFDLRSPGYPLLLAAVLGPGGNLEHVVWLQMALTLAAGLGVVFVLRRRYARLAWLPALAMGIYLAGPLPSSFDATVVTESPYTSALIGSFALLFLGLAERRAGALAAASALMALAIWIRPAGLFLAVIYALVLAFLLWNRFGRARSAAFAVPFAALLLGLASYNRASVGHFAVSTFGENNWIGTVSTFLEPSDAFPPEINAAIVRIHGYFTPEERAIAARSWDAEALIPVYARGYNPLVHGELGLIRVARDQLGLDYLEARPLLREVCLHAIRTHPLQYVKWVYANWSTLMSFHRRRGYEGLEVARWRHLRLGESEPLVALFQRTGTPFDPEAAPAPPRGLAAAAFGAVEHLHEEQLASPVFRWLFYAGFLYAAWMLARSRGRDVDAFGAFLLGAIGIGASLLVALIELAIFRYAYPTDFALWLLPALVGAQLASRGSTPAHAGGPAAASGSAAPSSLDSRTVADFGEQWLAFTENRGYYASSDCLADVFGGLLPLEAVRGVRVADIGSGTGRIVNMLLDAGAAHVVAVEPSEAVAVLRRNLADRADRVTVLHARGDTIPPSGDLGLVVSIGVLHHIVDPRPVLEAARAALLPGGRVLVWLYGREGNRLYLAVFGAVRRLTMRLPHRALYGLSGALRRVADLYAVACRLPLPMHGYMRGHWQRLGPAERTLTVYDQLNPAYAKYYTREEAQRLLAGAGFEDVRLHHRHGYSWTVLGTRP